MAFKLVVDLEGNDTLSQAIEDADRAVEEASQNMEESLEGVQGEMGETEGATQGLGDSIGTFLRNPMVLAAGAIGAAGLALNAFVESTREGSQAIGITALNTGILRSDLRNLATEVSNVTLKAGDAARGFRLMSTFGIDSADDMRAIIIAADTLSTAVGGDVVDSIQSLRAAAFGAGTDLRGATEDMDALGIIATRLGSEGLNRFNRNIGLLGPTFQKTGLDIKDFAAFMLAVNQTGIDLNVVMPRLRIQLEQLGDEGADAQTIYEKVGQEFNATAEEMQEFRDEVDLGTVAVENQAIEMARSLGPISEFKSALDDLKFEFGDILAPIADLGDAMLGLAATLVVISLAGPPAVVAMTALLAPLAALVGLTVLMTGLVLILIIAVVALGAALIFDFAGIRTFWKEFLDDLFKVSETIRDIKDTFTNLPFTEGGLFGKNKDHNDTGILRVNDNVRFGQGPNADNTREANLAASGVQQQIIFQGDITTENVEEVLAQIQSVAGGVLPR